MAALWDPRTLLEIDLDSCAPCVGTTLKNTRCRQNFKFFRRADLQKASRLLDEMSTCQPAHFRSSLSLLAEYTLCPRHHCNQPNANKVARGWWNIICARYPNGIVPVRPVRPVISAASVPAAPPVPITRQSRTVYYDMEESVLDRRRNILRPAFSRSAAPSPPESPSPVPRALFRPTSTVISTPSTSHMVSGLVTPPLSPSPRQWRTESSDPVLDETEEEPGEESEEEEFSEDSEGEESSEEDNEREESSEEDNEEDESTEEDLEEEDVDEERLGEERHEEEHEEVEHEEEEHEVEHEEVEHEEDEFEEDYREDIHGNQTEERAQPTLITSAEASLSQTPPATPQRARPLTSTTWLPLTPEPIQTTTCPHSSRRKPLTDDCPICNEEMHCLDDAVWCRAQCGQNMHRRCFAPWRQECIDREAVVTCVYCRTPWKYEWEE